MFHSNFCPLCSNIAPTRFNLTSSNAHICLQLRVSHPYRGFLHLTHYKQTKHTRRCVVHNNLQEYFLTFIKLNKGIRKSL